VILEGIVTTINDDGGVNVSPMGPLVDRAISQLVLRPFKTSRTFANLQRAGCGVLHVTDNVELMAHAAVGRLDPVPQMQRLPAFNGYVLTDACRWYAFKVKQILDPTERATVECEIIDRGVQREFFGFNRAQFAVIEACILATRIDRIEQSEIREELKRLKPLIKKTAGDRETRAFEFLKNYFEERWAE
jgi:hypothetical protein